MGWLGWVGHLVIDLVNLEFVMGWLYNTARWLVTVLSAMLRRRNENENISWI